MEYFTKKNITMTKVAKLVTLAITTRVVADKSEGEDFIIERALDNFKANPDEYLVPDNLEEIQDDVECPYGTYSGEKLPLRACLFDVDHIGLSQVLAMSEAKALERAYDVMTVDEFAKKVNDEEINPELCWVRFVGVPEEEE